MTRRWFLGVAGLWPFRAYIKDTPPGIPLEQQRVGPDCVGCGKYDGIYGPVGGAICVVCYEKTDAYRAWEP